MTQSNKEDFYILVGKAIRDARLNAGLNQETLADKINMSRASIVNIEKGRQNPPLYLLWQFSELLKVPITDLLPKFTLTTDDDDFFEQKLRYKTNKGIINEKSQKSLQSFLKNI